MSGFRGALPFSFAARIVDALLRPMAMGSYMLLRAFSAVVMLTTGNVNSLSAKLRLEQLPKLAPRITFGGALFPQRSQS
jgi:hypothetical protein